MSEEDEKKAEIDAEAMGGNDAGAPEISRDEDVVESSEENAGEEGGSETGEGSLSGYGGIFEEEEVESGGYGEFVVEEFSADKTTDRVVKVTHMSERLARHIVLWVYFSFGLILSVASLVLEEIYETHIIITVFPFVAGVLMLIFGVAKLVVDITRKNYLNEEKNSTASSIIFIIMGLIVLADTIVTLVEREPDEEEITFWANGFIGIVWGVYGLVEAARAFNHAINRMVKHENATFHVIWGLIELVFAILLIYNPNEHIALHLVIFGLQLMFTSITRMPFIRERAMRKT
ncbi:MAG: hypothetical protein LUD29_00010 [Clostridia bacterium]|nr:hypothetical protein [Clostridia bacterium]